MSVIVDIRTTDRVKNADFLVKVTSIIREALRAENLFNGHTSGESFYLHGYHYFIEVNPSVKTNEMKP